MGVFETGEFRLLGGYVAYNGHVFTERQAKTYNRACDNASQRLMVNGLNSLEHNHAKSHRHLCFSMIIGEA